jgi:hypothetical protein
MNIQERNAIIANNIRMAVEQQRNQPVRIFWATNRQEPIFVSAEDVDLVQWGWALNPDGYPVCWIDGRCQKLHDIILQRKGWVEIPKGSHCDHRDRNRANATRSNIRVLSATQSRQHRLTKVGQLGYRGVKVSGRGFVAYIGGDHLKASPEVRADIEMAGLDYDRAALNRYGAEFPGFNFPGLMARISNI